MLLSLYSLLLRAVFSRHQATWARFICRATRAWLSRSQTRYWPASIRVPTCVVLGSNDLQTTTAAVGAVEKGISPPSHASIELRFAIGVSKYNRHIKNRSRQNPDAGRSSKIAEKRPAHPAALSP
jgi:hypothetical protein